MSFIRSRIIDIVKKDCPGPQDINCVSHAPSAGKWLKISMAKFSLYCVRLGLDRTDQTKKPLRGQIG